jgi:cell division protein FtsW (lipid II flippase)
VGRQDLRGLSVAPPDERPKAPWHPFPLVELGVLAGIVLLVLGLINYESDRGKAMLVSGMLLGSLGGLDTALREHFAGYRSHTMILAGLPAVGLAAILYFAGAPWPAVILGAGLAFAALVPLLLRAFRRRER